MGDSLETNGIEHGHARSAVIKIENEFLNGKRACNVVAPDRSGRESRDNEPHPSYARVALSGEQISIIFLFKSTGRALAANWLRLSRKTEVSQAGPIRKPLLKK
jgi:hypothetical protein